MAKGNRTGRYVQPTCSGHVPACIVGVAVSPRILDREGESGAGRSVEMGRVHVAFSRRSGGSWSRPAATSFDTASQFWSWLERWVYPKRKAYVFAPVASDALTLLGFWNRVDRLKGRLAGRRAEPRLVEGEVRIEPAFVFDRLVLRGKPDIVDYQFNGKRYCWLSLCQYFELSHYRLAQATAWPGLSRYDPDVDAESQPLTPAEIADLTRHAAVTLAEWWGSLDAGGFGRTIGQMGLNYLRSGLQPKALVTHKDERAIALERLACHGGRASTWYFGDVVHRSHWQPENAPPFPSGSPWRREEVLYHVDVRSMYPHIMATADMPTSLVSYTTTVSPSGLREIMKGYTAVAYVTLSTTEAEYPHREGDYVVYPVGKFRSVLAGLELQDALSRGLVTRVHQAAIYTRGKPFAGAASRLLELRRGARCTGNTGWETFIKLLSNSVTGKLAQRSAVWVERPGEHAERDWGEWLHRNAAEGTVSRRRAIAGMVWELDRSAGGTGTLTACYAHITAAGRMMMRDIRSHCPPRSVYSQDTDGLWVTLDAVRSLEAVPGLFGPEAGQLRVVEQSTASRFWGPKHYYAAGRWVLAGLHNPGKTPSPIAFSDDYTENRIRSACDCPPMTIKTVSRTVTLSLTPHDGEIGADGWQRPSVLPRRPNTGMPVVDDPPTSFQPLLEFEPD